MSSMKKEITLINDYCYTYLDLGDYVPVENNILFANEIKKRLSLRGISLQTPNEKNYYHGMSWGGNFKSSEILMLLHSELSSSSGEILDIVKWAKDNKKTLLIVTLDDTPLTDVWELILVDYKQYLIINYNASNPNETIFKIEESINKIDNREEVKESINKTNDRVIKKIEVDRDIETKFYLFLSVIALGFCTLSILVAFDIISMSSAITIFIILSFVAILCYYIINKYTLNKLQQQMQMPRKSDKVQPTLADNKKIEYKCFIAGATTITEERDAVRASLSQVVNRWGSLDIMLSCYTFEDFDNNHQQQMRYDEFIQNEADCVIVIITDGIGPKTIGEYRLAVSTLQKTKKRPKVVVYADEKSKNDQDVEEFKKEVENNKTYWVSYTSLNELKEKIQNEMTKQLLPIVQETIKKS